MSMLLGLFTSRTTWILVAVFAVSVFMGVQQARIAGLKNALESERNALEAARAELAQAQATILQWRNAYAGLTDALERQNAELDRLESETARRIAAAKEALLAAAEAKARGDRLAATLYSLETTNDECQDMARLLDTARAGGLH